MPVSTSAKKPSSTPAAQSSKFFALPRDIRRLIFEKAGGTAARVKFSMTCKKALSLERLNSRDARTVARVNAVDEDLAGFSDSFKHFWLCKISMNEPKGHLTSLLAKSSDYFEKQKGIIDPILSPSAKRVLRSYVKLPVGEFKGNPSLKLRNVSVDLGAYDAASLDSCLKHTLYRMSIVYFSPIAVGASFSPLHALVSVLNSACALSDGPDTRLNSLLALSQLIAKKLLKDPNSQKLVMTDEQVYRVRSQLTRLKQYAKTTFPKLRLLSHTLDRRFNSALKRTSLVVRFKARPFKNMVFDVANEYSKSVDRNTRRYFFNSKKLKKANDSALIFYGFFIIIFSLYYVFDYIYSFSRYLIATIRLNLTRLKPLDIDEQSTDS